MIVRVEGQPPAERIVVVSPHFDDGVLSLGASAAAWRRAGASVRILTVFGGDPDSTAPAGGWDRRGGFPTEGEAARARREEDRLACAVIGATPVPLAFGSVDYERGGDERAVHDAVVRALDAAQLVLLPGSPLSHPDHEWLARTLFEGLGAPIGLYAEQPYTLRSGREPQVPGWLTAAVGGNLAFEPVTVGPRDRLAKWRSVRRYRSQLPLLGMHRSLRGGAHRHALLQEQLAVDTG
jgi:LmbE family N-acetylglucosaminyl deacetylase